ncbi:MAG: hypothetical protein QME96_13400, partial [Myxococcota bacterium]|nr:hypothetical protein [Myxococcota bacterium]
APTGDILDDIDDKIGRHTSHFKTHERADFLRARRYYKGEFWRDRARVDSDDPQTFEFRATKNITFAIAQTALVSLVSPNLAVAANPQTEASARIAPAIDALIRWSFRANKMRRRSQTAILDGVLLGRGCYKTGWSDAHGMPITRAVDPSRLFFDLFARDPDDIRYWLEAVPLPETEYRRRVESGEYATAAKDPVIPSDRSDWIDDFVTGEITHRVRATGKWVDVWEYYDVERGTVVHYHQPTRTVLLHDSLRHVPYSMFALNPSGTDCSGVSEIRLILDQQRTINTLLSLLKRIAYLMVPRVLYDAGVITEEDVNKLVNASPGAFVPMTARKDSLGAAQKALADVFWQAPMPEHPQGVFDFLARSEDDAAFVSALADLARGQKIGARTATELAVMETMMKTRVSALERNAGEAIEDVAAKHLWLCQRHLPAPRRVRISGGAWTTVYLHTLRDVDVDFEMVAHSPVRMNPAVMLEQIVALLPSLLQFPNVDAIALAEELVGHAGFSRDVLLSREEAMNRVAAAAQAEAAKAMGGAAAVSGAQPGQPPGGMPAEGQVPQAQLPEGQAPQAQPGRANRTMESPPGSIAAVPGAGPALAGPGDGRLQQILQMAGMTTP